MNSRSLYDSYACIMVSLCMAITPSLTRTGGGENMRYVMKCRNRKCTTEIISNDADRCPVCGTTDIETESIQDLDTMGISETRIMIRIDGHNPGTFQFLQDENAVLYIEDSGLEMCMPHMMLTKKFASNARIIRVTVDIVE